MEEKLQLMPSLQDAFAIGMKNVASIVVAVLLWAVTIWIPYLNVGTTIAMATLPVKLSKGEAISPTFIFDAEYRHCMGEYFILQAIINSAVGVAMFFMFIPGIVLSFSWMLAVYLLVGKKMNWAQCLTESNRLMMGYKLKVFCLKFLVGAVLCIGSFILYMIFGAISEFLGFIVLILVILVGVCVSTAVDAVIYRELVLNAEASGEEHAVEE